MALFNFKSLMVIGSFIILFFSGCSQNESAKDSAVATKPNGVSQSSETIPPLSFPNLDGLEKEAKDSVLAAQDTLSQVLADPAAIPQNKAQAYGSLGVLYFAFGFHDAAKVSFQHAINLQPDHHAWHFYFGQLPGDNNSARIKALKTALDSDRENIEVLVSLGQVLFHQNQMDEAKTTFGQALILSPEHPVVHYYLGLAAKTNQQDQIALEHFQKTLAGDPRASAAHYQLGLLLKKMGEEEAAEAQMALRGDRTPTAPGPMMKAVIVPSALAHYRLAENLRLSGSNKDAVSHYDQTVELLPRALGPRVGRALNMVQSGQHPEVLVRLRDDLKFFPNNAVLLHLLARLLAASPHETVRDGQKSLQLMHILGKGTVNAEMVETLAMAFAEVGNFDKAIEFQQRALSVTDESDTGFFSRLQLNLANYQQKMPCRLPWPEDDPIFNLNTYLAMQLFPQEDGKEESPAP